MRSRALLLLALAPLLAGCGAQSPAPPLTATKPQAVSAPSGRQTGSSTTQSPAALGMEPEQIGGDYLWVAKSANTGKSPMLQVAGTRYGVVVALPPHYGALPGGAAPSAQWFVYLSHPSAGKQNLLQTAQRLAALPKGQTDVTILGVTSKYAAFGATTASGRLLELVTLAGGGAGALRSVGQLESAYGGAVAIRGMVFYLGPHGTVHVLHIASGQTASVTGVAPGPLIWWQNGLQVGLKAVKVPGVEPPAAPPVPAGFQAIAIGSSTSPIAAVPQGYTVRQLPGGSSNGVSAQDPKDSAIQVTIYQNACAGCYNPGFMAQGVNTLSTPIYVGALTGTTPLGDHGFVTKVAQKGGLVQYMLIADYLDGGDLEASVTVPKTQGALAQEILGTVRLPW